VGAPQTAQQAAQHSPIAWSAMVRARGEGSTVKGEPYVEAAEESRAESRCWRDAKSYIRSAAVTLRPREDPAEDTGHRSCVGRARRPSGTARRSALFSRGDDDSDAIRAVRAQAPARVVPVDVPRAAWRREAKRGTRCSRAPSRRVRPTWPFEATNRPGSDTLLSSFPPCP
jgi:hypothetical protein